MSNAATRQPTPLDDHSTTVIDSAPIDQLVANSTIDIAHTLVACRSRWRTYKALIAILSILFVVAAIVIIRSGATISPIAAFTMAAGAVLILGSLLLHGRQSSIVLLDYELSADQSKRFEALTRAFTEMACCRRIWNIPLEKQEADWKRNAGASKVIERKQVHLATGNPPLVATNMDFLKLPVGKETIYLTPDVILVTAGNAVAGFCYGDVEVTFRHTRFIEEEAPPMDATVVGQTWRYVNRSGGPDRRFNNNRQLPICLYGEIDLRSAGGLNERIQCSRVDVAEVFVSSVTAMSASLQGRVV
ncbi:hypothetical protein [Bradyrhizobium sp. SRL28]|uniref:hypothetical protein n=1 Tax=Bradyrhizobium sp. SRL28 TaxID=2836178 RepID=UPI00201C646C|nr:hypothetical protein [Bradyrhizobium sp. SRL28]